MKRIIFPGHNGRPCEARYGVHFEDHQGDSIAHIVVVQGERERPGMNLLDQDESRDNVLNRILESELKGVRLDYIRVHILQDFSKTLMGVDLATGAGRIKRSPRRRREAANLVHWWKAPAGKRTPLLHPRYWIPPIMRFCYL
ncbi:hypothetical protein [Pseudomonas sp. JG-B]|uniref:hypothetical protein n=1 Tax=Pseudomonas sp. JG-B TaxID=2603214 RepID=UPI00129ED134|nr:hypothetical protein [Pseudomonas sp. JG-B]MRK19072.1 hypothetical protein [Pseudomonas sp. JG-B]